MNWPHFKKKSLGMRMQLVPPASGEVPDEWLVESFPSDSSVRLVNVTTQHGLLLGKDHIHEFRSNSQRGAEYGFLILNMQITVNGSEIALRPVVRAPTIATSPRRLDEAAKRRLLLLVKPGKTVHIVVGIADVDGLRFAEEVRLFLESQGRSVNKVRQTMPGPSRRGQDVDEHPDRYEIVIGSA